MRLCTDYQELNKNILPDKMPLQGSTIGVRRVRMYAYFYWRTHDFGDEYVGMYTHFVPIIF